MIKNLSIENFKSFGKEQKINFAPITLFYGRNNSGKSSIFDLIKIISSSKNLNQLFSHDKLSSSIINYIHGYNKKSEIKFKINFCEEYYSYKTRDPLNPRFKEMNKRGTYNLLGKDFSKFDEERDLFDPNENKFATEANLSSQNLNFGISYKMNQKTLNKESCLIPSSFYYQKNYDKKDYFELKLIKNKYQENFSIQKFFESDLVALTNQIYNDDNNYNLIKNSIELSHQRLFNNINKINSLLKETKSILNINKIFSKSEHIYPEINQINNIFSFCLIRGLSFSFKLNFSKEDAIKSSFSGIKIAPAIKKNAEPLVQKANEKLFNHVLNLKKNAFQDLEKLILKITNELSDLKFIHKNIETFDDHKFEYFLTNPKFSTYDEFNKYLDKNIKLHERLNFYKKINYHIIDFILTLNTNNNESLIEIDSFLSVLDSTNLEKSTFILMKYLILCKKIINNNTVLNDVISDYYTNDLKYNNDKFPEIALITYLGDYSRSQVFCIFDKNSPDHYLLDCFDNNFNFNFDHKLISFEDISQFILHDLKNSSKSLNLFKNSLLNRNLNKFFEDILRITFSSITYDSNTLSLQDCDYNDDASQISYSYKYFDNLINTLVLLLNKKNRFSIAYRLSKPQLSLRNELIDSVVNVSLPSLFDDFEITKLDLDFIKNHYLVGERGIFENANFDELNIIIKNFGLQEKLKKKRYKGLRDEYYSIFLENSKGHLTNINDIGLGYKKILILITSLDFKEKIIYLEEPETNIHPEFQKGIGTSIIDSYLKGNNQILVETHSEHIILRILKEIREGRLNSSDLAINYISMHESETIVKNIKINEKGRFLDKWPHGFFTERLSEF